MKTTMIKSYSELIKLESYLDRFEYLRMNGTVADETFGSNRWLNQVFYTSPEWRRFRRQIIIRDCGCDMACEGYEISGERIIIHHINSISVDDILNRNISVLMNPENLICVTENTHNAIHYGDRSLLNLGPITRRPNDTCPWKR